MKWTGISGKDIEKAFDEVHIGYTYNLLLRLPRKIILDKEKVMIQGSAKQMIDPMNVSNLVSEDKHPLDTKP